MKVILLRGKNILLQNKWMLFNKNVKFNLRVKNMEQLDKIPESGF